MDKRVIEPNEVGVISKDDLEWIGASEIELHCYRCGMARTPLHVFFGDDEEHQYCGPCLILEWEESQPEERELIRRKRTHQKKSEE